MFSFLKAYGIFGTVVALFFNSCAGLFCGFAILVWTFLAVDKVINEWLLLLIRSNNEDVREYAAKALGRKGDYSYDERLAKTLQSESSPRVRSALIDTLVILSHKLLESAKDAEERHKTPSPPVLTIDPGPKYYLKAIKEFIVPAIAKSLRATDAAERRKALTALREIGTPEALAAVEAVHEPEPTKLRHRLEMPEVVSDRVHFSITAPPTLVAGSMAELAVWAYLEAQREQMLRRAAEQFGEGAFRTQTKGPVQMARGTVLMVRVKIEGISVRPREDTIIWEGEVGNASFVLQVPADALAGPRRGLATVHIDGVRILRIDFVIRVVAVPEAAASRPLDVTETRLRKAFASYASADRDAVLARIQGIQKGAPGLDIFLDVAHLHSGDHWQERLRAEILRRDVLYLFWSEAASKSPWVEWEWRCALQERGIDFIDPVPLVSPKQVPPPPELAGTLHFNDWVLAFLGGSRS